jgi:hypothetical protein
VERPQADRKAADLSARDQGILHTRRNDRTGSAHPGEAFSGDAYAEHYVKQARTGHAASPTGSDTTHAERNRTRAGYAVPDGTDPAQAERYGVRADRS